jgi:ABC-type dipeptide/oligopeptide/nickel transport system permease component
MASLKAYIITRALLVIPTVFILLTLVFFIKNNYLFSLKVTSRLKTVT